jgi:hypothetical protein
MSLNWGLAHLVLSVAWAGQVDCVPAVDLRFPTACDVDEQARARLSDAALKLLASSNFNSRGRPSFGDWTPRKAHADYRKVVSGPYMAVSFDGPRMVETIGGPVEVVEIVIGLGLTTRDSRGRDYPGPLYTIDGEGRVVRHEKWGGGLGLELLRIIRDVAHAT